MRNPRLVSEAIDASRATHLIKKGETLTKIAKEHHTTVNELAKINNIRDVNRIQAGATIKLSTKPITDTPTATAGVAPQQTLSHSSLSSPPERIKSPVTYESIGKELQKANQDIEADMKK